MLNIRHPEVDKLARALAKSLNESITEVVLESLREKWLKVQGRRSPNDLKIELNHIAQRCAHLPDTHAFRPEDVLGYDQYGLPT